MNPPYLETPGGQCENPGPQRNAPADWENLRPSVAEVGKGQSVLLKRGATNSEVLTSPQNSNILWCMNNVSAWRPQGAFYCSAR